MFGGSLYFDLRETRVRIIKGSAKKKIFRINGYADLELKYPLGKSLDNERNHEIGQQIVGFLKEHRLGLRRASVLIGREGIITRTTRVPALEKKVLDEFLHASMDEFLPVDPVEYAFDYRVMKIYRDAADGRNYYDLLLAAVPRYMVEQVMQIMKAARMMIKSIDILPNSLLRLFSCADYSDVAVLDISHDGSRIAICEDEGLLLYADIPFKLTGQETVDFSVLIDETRGYLNFFAARNQGRPVEALHVVGDLAQREALTSVLDGAFEIPVKADLDDILICKWDRDVDQSQTAVVAGNLGMMLRKD